MTKLLFRYESKIKTVSHISGFKRSATDLQKKKEKEKHTGDSI